MMELMKLSRKNIAEVFRMGVCKDEDGIRISKNLIAVITLIILLLTTVSTAVAYTVGVKSTVDQIDKELSAVQDILQAIQPRIGQNEKDIAVIKAHYESIDLNIKEIKETLSK